MSDEYEKMNPEIKEKWLDALASGEYKKGRGFLRISEGGSHTVVNPEADKFCCLGVLCDLYQKETGKGNWSGHDFHDGEGDSSGGDLPRAVRTWAGLTEANPNVKFTHRRTEQVYDPNTDKMVKRRVQNTHSRDLADINDETVDVLDKSDPGSHNRYRSYVEKDRYTFKHIADAIRKSL